MLVNVVSSWLLILTRLIAMKNYKCLNTDSFQVILDLQFAARLQIHSSDISDKMSQIFRSVCLNVHIHIDT